MAPRQGPAVLGEHRHRPARPRRTRPTSPSGLRRTPTCWPPSTSGPRALLGALEGVDVKEEAWTWSDDHTVGFILRRQAHEALIHRLDAELTAGASSEVAANLAADGVAEMIGVMFGGCPPWGSWEPLPHYARLDCTDTGDELWAQFGLFCGTDPDSGDVISRSRTSTSSRRPTTSSPTWSSTGRPRALDAWLWHRGDDSELSIAGDRSILDRFRGIVSHPIT